MASSSFTCYYDVLGVPQEATAAAIKKSYHAQALRWHPDKNGDDPKATEMFKQVQEAYEVLSDPQERGYYDANRDHVLQSDDDDDEPEVDEAEPELDLYKWASREAFVDFSYETDGFFAVYTSVFEGLHEQEKTGKDGKEPRPGFGSAGSTLEAVTAFYAYWLRFSTCRSERAFAKHDKWDLADAPSPLMRRLMQQKNKAIREKARKMFNDKVRRLAQFVKSMDPRECGHVADGDSANDAVCEEAGASESNGAADDKGSFHCAACNKWYKNAGQLSNHERSTKHKQAVARAKAEVRKAAERADDLDLEELEDVDGMDSSAAGGEGPASAATRASVHGEPTRPRDGAEEGSIGGGGDGGLGGGRSKHRHKGAGGIEEPENGDTSLEEAVASMALPSPGLVALQTRQMFEASDEYKKLNKTQRRKALQQWEAEHEHMMEALRAEGKEPKTVDQVAKKKPAEEAKKAPKEKLHGSGAHSREIKTPKKKKAVYGAKTQVVDVE